MTGRLVILPDRSKTVERLVSQSVAKSSTHTRLLWRYYQPLNHYAIPTRSFKYQHAWTLTAFEVWRSVPSRWRALRGAMHREAGAGV